MKLAGLVTGGVGLGLVVTSLVFGSRAADKEEQVESYRGEWTTDILEVQQAGQSAERVSVITGIAGGAAVIAGTALFLYGRSQSKRSSVDVAVRPGAVEVAWAVSF
jgi:hypothetical protein